MTAWTALVAAGCSSSQTEAEAPAIVSEIDGDSAKPGRLDAEIPFTDATEAGGIDFTYRNGYEVGHYSILESLGGGVAVFDYDNDDQPDLFFPGGGEFREKQILPRPSLLARNRGGWHWQDVSQASGLRHSKFYSHGVAVGDYDNDGFSDLVMTGYGGLQLFHNQGDGTFVEVGAAASLVCERWSSSVGWGDVNGDGDLDLYVVCYVNWSFENNPHCPGAKPGSQDVCSPRKFDGLPDALFLSNGDGTFRNGSQEAGLRQDGKGLGVVLGDVDLDNDLDVYVANDTVANFLYLNGGDGKLAEVGVVTGVALDDSGRANGSMGVDLGDYDGDGWPDIWVANYENESFALYRNIGAGSFLNVSALAGATSVGGLYVGFGTSFLDFDRDGDEDLIVSNGHVIRYPRAAPVLQQPLLLENNGQGRFSRMQPRKGSYFDAQHLGRGLAVGDLDGDGDLDAAVSHNNAPVTLLRNDDQTTAAWLAIRLVGRTCNRDGIGSRLILHTTAGDRLQLVIGGGSYQSHGDRIAYWGLPEGTTAERVTIVWPGGSEESLEIGATNTTRRFVQSK